MLAADIFRYTDVNACKTFGCPNFGVLNSPLYALRGQNILCQACGFHFPVISAAALNAFKLQVNRSYQGLIWACAHCGKRDGLTRHGYTQSGQQRVRCASCRSTFAWYEHARLPARLSSLAGAIRAGQPLRELSGFDSKMTGRDLQQLAFSARLACAATPPFTLETFLATAAFSINFNGSPNRLYVIVTVEKKSDRVIAITTNYAPRSEHISFEYRYSANDEELIVSREPLTRIFAKDRVMKRRALFFDTRYGAARLKINDAGVIVKPVLAAYRHFEVVKSLTQNAFLYVQHYIEHECFIYGGCLMANREEVATGHCHIAFVYEKGNRTPQQPFRSQIITSRLIWNDVWRCFSQPDYQMAVCSLTGQQRSSELRQATLQPAQRFIDFILRHPFYPQLVRLSPANVSAVLEFLAAEYNQGAHYS